MSANSESTTTNETKKKSSVSEKGHAKNVANFKLLITQAEALGATYNPSNPKILLPKLQSIYATAFQQQNVVNTTTGPYSDAVAARENLFKPLNRLITKLRKAYKSTEDVQLNQVENFMTFARKIKGDKKVSKTPVEDQHSAAQLSFDQRTNSLNQLVVLLENTEKYNPNEEAFKVATLKAMYNEMLVKTDKVTQTYVPLNNARSQRNDTVYLNPDNLVDIAYTVKDYLFTILDTDNVQYKSISKIRFSRL
jgi:hypothetical protein